jgi:hypothetical protein
MGVMENQSVLSASGRAQSQKTAQNLPYDKTVGKPLNQHYLIKLHPLQEQIGNDTAARRHCR